MSKKRKNNVRDEMIEQGAYDGRYNTKIVVDKKKKQSKGWARKKQSE